MKEEPNSLKEKFDGQSLYISPRHYSSITFDEATPCAFARWKSPVVPFQSPTLPTHK